MSGMPSEEKNSSQATQVSEINLLGAECERRDHTVPKMSVTQRIDRFEDAHYFSVQQIFAPETGEHLPERGIRHFQSCLRHRFHGIEYIRTAITVATWPSIVSLSCCVEQKSCGFEVRLGQFRHYDFNLHLHRRRYYTVQMAVWLKLPNNTMCGKHSIHIFPVHLF